MKIVLDSNIFIAAALKAGLAEDIIKIAATTTIISLITSEAILSELHLKLETKFNWTEDTITFYVDRIREVATIVSSTEIIAVIERDPDDNKILECAVAGQADLIVSADQDLIALKDFRGIAIIHPKTLTWTLPDYFKKIR